MKKITFTFFAFLLAISFNHAQDTGGFAFGIKGGPTIGFQKWGNFEQDPLFSYHAIAYIESLTPAGGEGNFTLFGQAGYHNRGSAIRTRSFVGVDPSTGMDREFGARSTNFKFQNFSLAVGAKQRFDFGEKSKLYYMIGLRGDYHFKNNLRDFDVLNSSLGYFYFPIDEFGWVKDFTFGGIIGGGIEYMISDHFGITAELTVNPDFTNQYNQPPIENVPDPFTGNTRTIQERLIKNNTIELTIGLRFLRIVEYID